VNLVLEYFRELGRSTVAEWNRFWFKPVDPATLSLIRILAGLMLLYTHLVWSLDLEAFFGSSKQSWVNLPAAQETLLRPDWPERIPSLAELAALPKDAPFVRPPVGRHSFSWSYFWLIDSPKVLWGAHIAALVVFALFTLGLWSRVTSILAYLITVAYLNRTPGAQFGLDNVNVMLAMYLMIGPTGAAYSLDRWLARRRAGGQLPVAPPSITANIATRLIQLHMCVIYLSAGTGKLMGESWWNGEAIWMSFANLEYQSMDMTWLADYPMTVNLMTHVTIFWEVSFCFLVWHRLLRPLVLAVSVPLHLGIAFCMGMITFGLVMLIGCLSFVSPWLIRTVLEGKAVPAGAGQGGVPESEPETREGRRNSETARPRSEKPHLEGTRRKTKGSPRA
jgi:hypothetical protein